MTATTWAWVAAVALVTAGCSKPRQEQARAPEPAVAAGEAEDAALTVRDAKTGITVSVDEGGRVVRAVAEDGGELFGIDVIDECGVPAVGSARVRNLVVVSGQATVVYGKHDHARIDLATGEIRCTGSD
jgi:ABC-type enterochelin transport system substrate-binding protein